MNWCCTCTVPWVLSIGVTDQCSFRFKSSLLWLFSCHLALLGVMDHVQRKFILYFSMTPIGGCRCSSSSRRPGTSWYKQQVLSYFLKPCSIMSVCVWNTLMFSSLPSRSSNHKEESTTHPSIHPSIHPSCYFNCCTPESHGRYAVKSLLFLRFKKQTNSKWTVFFF